MRKSANSPILRWSIFILILPHLKPPCLEYVLPVLDTVFDACRFISAVFLLFLYISSNRVPSKPVWILAFLQSWLLMVTLANGNGEMRVVIFSSISILAVVGTIDYFSVYPATLIRGLMWNMEWLIYGNLISIILTYPRGLYISGNYHHDYFLGYHNGFFQYVLISLLVAALYSCLEKKKARPFCLAAAGYLCVLITWSATSVAALTLVAALMLLPPQKLKHKITFASVFCTTMAANLAISVFRIMDRVSWVSWIIENILHKQSTLTGRTYIWDQFQQKFAARPFWGYGVGDHVFDPFSGGLVGTHNQYFELLLSGGVLALALFIFFNFAMGKSLNRCENIAVRSIFLSVLAGLYVIFIAESYETSLVYMLMMLACHADKFAAVSGPTTRRLRFVIKRGDHVTNRKLN